MVLDIWGKNGSIIGLPLAKVLPELEGQQFLRILIEVFQQANLLWAVTYGHSAT